MIMLSRKKNLTHQNEVILRNEVVHRVNEVKFLGVIVDQQINSKTIFQWYLKKIPSHLA